MRHGRPCTGGDSTLEVIDVLRRTVVLLAALVACLLAAVPAVARPFPSRIDLPDGWAPEGITAGRGTTAFVGSLVDGAIARVDLLAGSVELLAAGAPGRVAVGLDYEAGADRLWVAGGMTGQVRAYDASTGAPLETYQFTAGFLNDVAVTRDAVYVTDSGIQQLIVIPLAHGSRVPDPASAFALPISGDLQYAAGFNANGIVEFAGWLIVPQSNTGALYAIEPGTGRSVEILPPGSVTNGDGLELVGSTLYVVRNTDNLVARFSIRGGAVVPLGTQVSAALDVPTTAAVVAGQLWVVNARFTTPPGPTTEYWITRLPTR
jgi:hypothetical protein